MLLRPTLAARRYYGQIKPDGIPAIDWSHPITRGLIDYWWPIGTSTVNGAPQYVNLVNGRRMQGGGTGGANKNIGGAPITTPYGNTLSLAAGAAMVQDRANHVIQAWPNVYSMACGWWQAVAANNGGGSVGWFAVADNLGNDPFAIYLLGSPTTHFFLSYGNGNGTDLGLPPAAGTFNVVVGVATGTATQVTYLNNGAPLAGTQSPSGYSGTNLKTLFGSTEADSAASGVTSGAAPFFGAVWIRALSHAEARLLYFDPYSFLLPSHTTSVAPAFSTGVVVSNLTAAQTIPAFTQTFTAAALANITAAQTIPAFAQTATLTAVASLTATQTIPAFTQTFTVAGATAANLTAAQTIPDFAQTFNVATIASLTTTQTIPAFSQTVTVSTGAANLSAAQTIPDFAQTFTAKGIEQITAAQTIPAFSQTFTISLVASLSASQTIPAFAQTASMSAVVTLTAAQTIPDFAQAFTVQGPIVASAGFAVSAPFIANMGFMMIRGGGGGGAAPVADWVDDWKIGGTLMPSVVLDFAANRYYDGSSNSAALSSMVQNASLNAGGLKCDNPANNACLGPLLAALLQTTGSVCVETINGVNNTIGGIVSLGSGGPDFILLQNGTAATVRSFNGTIVDSNATTAFWAQITRMASNWNASDRRISLVNFGAVATGAGNYTPSTTAVLGSWNGTDAFLGQIRRLAVYPTKVSDLQLKGLSGWGYWWLPFNGACAVFPTNAGDNIQAGNVLQYNFTQPWTMECSANVATIGGTQVFFTNVGVGAPFTGYEVFFFPDGKLRSRIMSAWDGVVGHTGIIDVNGGTVFSPPNSPQAQYLAVTYDGSGVAAGIKMYVNGVPETLTTVADTLTGSSASPDAFWIGNQVATADPVKAILGPFIMSNRARSAAEIAARAASPRMPAVDADTVLYYDFREGSGTTTVDRSASGFNGTLSSSSLWP